MKRMILILAVLFTAFGVKAQQVIELEKSIDAIRKENGMKHGILSVSVYNITKGKSVYGYNQQVALTPGSVVKLFTTGAGFSRLGSNFRFATKLCIRGEVDRDGVLRGNVYIIGGGDPLLGSYRYRQTSPDSLFDGWSRSLKKKGIKRVEGRVCYYTGIFDNQTLNDSWQWGDVGNYFGAGVSGLNFHENMFFVYFNPGTKVGYPATSVKVSPKNLNVRGTCEVTTGPENSDDNVVIYGSPDGIDRLYRGTVPLGKNEFAVRGAMPNPARQCADLFATYLRTHGVSVSSNSLQVFSLPDSLRTVLDYYSSDYYTIAQYTNLTSNNIYAEAIFKYLGYRLTGLGSFASGVSAVEAYFKDLGLNSEGVNLVDGSGLSNQNRVTADFLCRYLAAVSQEDYFDDFLHSLAKVGESGTAKKLLPTLPNGISVRLKTGTIKGAKAYAGYIDAANGDRLVFSIISNNHDCTSTVAAEKLNKILLKIATLY
ncbi:MAG: D-alanyl-D-alanine carboxypeptidase/D-alanyl-D-alanine endopeptidase [bacterium]